MSIRRRAYTITIIADRCKECGLCIHVCPKNVLETGPRQNRRGFRVTVPARPQDCVGCKMCEFTCPDFVIAIEPAVNGEPKGVIVWSSDEVEEITP